MRRAQGYGIGELLEELDLLSAQVLSEVAEACTTGPSATPQDVLALVGRLRASFTRSRS